MRHKVFGRKFDRTANHRQSMFKNLVSSLVARGRITTTKAKAKAIRGLVDKLINRAKQRTVAARRLLLKVLRHQSLVNKLVDEVAPQLKDRTSGYTRLTALGTRRGDSASIVALEFVGRIEPLAKSKIKSTKKTTRKTITQTAALKTPKLKTPLTTKAASQAHRTQSKG